MDGECGWLGEGGVWEAQGCSPSMGWVSIAGGRGVLEGCCLLV